MIQLYFAICHFTLICTESNTNMHVNVIDSRVFSFSYNLAGKKTEHSVDIPKNANVCCGKVEQDKTNQNKIMYYH